MLASKKIIVLFVNQFIVETVIFVVFPPPLTKMVQSHHRLGCGFVLGLCCCGSVPAGGSSTRRTPPSGCAVCPRRSPSGSSGSRETWAGGEQSEFELHRLCFFIILCSKNEIRSLKSRDCFDSGGLHLLCEGAERVAEGLCGQVQESLQEDVDLQRVEAFALICRRSDRALVRHGGGASLVTLCCGKRRVAGN